jgi:hypothetical protein
MMGQENETREGSKRSRETKRGAEELLIHWGYALINMSDIVLISVCK